jgi:hypothetical protein
LRILGLSADATRTEVQGSYRKLALMYHPDVNRDAEANSRFRAISEAFQSLDEHIRMREVGESADVTAAVRDHPAIARMSSPRLRRYMRHSPFWQTRASAAVALSLRAGGKDAVAEAMQDPDRRVRAVVAGVIAENFKPRDIGRLFACLKIKNIDTLSDSLRTALQIIQKRWRDPECMPSGAAS